MPRVLTYDQVSHFKREGFVVVPDFFSSDELEALRAEIVRMHDEGQMRNVATLEDRKTRNNDAQNLQLIPLDTRSDLFRALPFAPKVIESVRSLLGDPVVKILDQLFMKPAHTGLPTNWHTDNAYFRISQPLAGTAMWVAIDDATRENGTLKVIPRVFDTRFEHFPDPHSDHHIRMAADDAQAIHCELPAGGVVFFCYGTPHATGPNLTAQSRTGVGLHFLNANYVNREGVAQEEFNCVQLTGADADGGESKYGTDLRGTWGESVESVLRGGG